MRGVLDRGRRVVRHPQLGDAVRQAEGREHGRVGAAHEVPAGLAEPVVVEQRPREDGPAVVELPHERPRAVRLAPPVVLDAELQRLGLRDLRAVDELVEVVRDARDRLEQQVDLVLRLVLGVVVERRAVVVELVGRDPAPQRLAVGRGEDPELRDEAPAVLGVAGVGDPFRAHRVVGRLAEAARVVAVPDLPVVHVAVLARVVVGAPERRAGPVRDVAVELGDHAREDLVVEARAGDPRAAALGELAVVDPLVLVVAAPQRERGPAAQAGDLVARLGLDLGGERRPRGRSRRRT